MLSEGVVLLANCSGQTKPARGVIKPMAVAFWNWGRPKASLPLAREKKAVDQISNS